MSDARRRRLTWGVVVAWALGTALYFVAWLLIRDPGLELELRGRIGQLGSLFLPTRWDRAAQLWTLDAFGLRVAAARAFLLGSAAAGALLCALHWRAVRREIADFVTLSAHPVNLAIFRIVVFSQAYSILWLDYIAVMAALPAELQVPPATGVPAIGPLAAFSHWPLHPFGPEQALFWGNVLKVFTVLGMVGLATRLSSAVVAFGLFFVWGTLQWYGKVDHMHHLLWFALVLASSRCGDAWSVDALVAAWRRGGRGRTEPPGPSPAYGAPLAMCMLLIGVIYLFPGLSKMAVSGLDWALSESPKHTMHRKWHTNGRWLPILPFDQFAILYRGGALFTLVFELAVLPLIVWRRTRLLAAALGIGFHTMNNVVMDIGFETLRWCYVVFFDWHRIGRWLRDRLGGPRQHAFDRDRSLQRRGVAIARALDAFDWVDWRPRDEPRRRAREPATAGARAAPALAVGSLIFVATLWTGAGRIQEGWPFACYPRFDGMTPDHYETLRIDVVDADGSRRTLLPADFRDTFGNRWSLFMRRAADTRDEELRLSRLRNIWAVALERDPSLARAESLRFSKARVWTEPSRWDEPPEEAVLLLEVPARDLQPPGPSGSADRHDGHDAR